MYSNYSLSEIRRANNELDGLFGTIGKVIGKAANVASGIFGAGIAVGAGQPVQLPGGTVVRQQPGGQPVFTISPNAPNTGAGGVALTAAQAEFLAQQRIAEDRAARNNAALPAWIIPAAIGGIGLLLVLSTRRK